MINRYFNFRLFKEGFRQTRLIALLSLVTILSFTGLIWLSAFAEQWQYPSQTLFNFHTVGGLLVAQYCITTPLMVLYLFRFLNRRDSSDFYHTIPHTREALSISYFSAILCWNAITTLSVTALVFLLYGCAPYMTINLTTVFPYLLNMCSAQFLVAAAVLFAMSITGTAFSNIAVSLLVIFVPRLLLLVMTNMVESYCVIVDIAQQYPLLNPCLNVAAGLPLSLFLSFQNGSDTSIIDCFTNPMGGIYTLIVALLLACAAIWLLKKRKSETAGKSSPSRLMQAIYRISFGTVIGLLPTYLAFDRILWDKLQHIGSWITLIILIVIASFCYFLFELIATKKVKNLLRAIPGLFIFLAIDAAILAASFGMGNAVLAFNPTVEDIQAITISQDEENYFVSKSNSVLIKDTASKRIVSQALNNTVEMVRAQEIHRNGHQIYGRYGSYVPLPLKVDFKTKFGHQHRYILLEEADYQTLLNTLEQQEDYKKCFYDLPQLGMGSAVVKVADHQLQNGMRLLNQSQIEQLYQVFTQEVNSMPFEQWYPIAIESHTSASFSFANLELTIADGAKDYWLTFPLKEDLFPKTTQQYLDFYRPYANEALDSAKTMLQEIGNSNLVMHENYDIDIITHQPSSQYLDMPDTLLYSFTQQLLANAKPYTTVGSGKAVFVVTIYKYTHLPVASQNVLIEVDPALLDGYLFPIEE